jgi:hypothetical protein
VDDALARTGRLAVDNSTELPTAPAFNHNSTAFHHHVHFPLKQRYKEKGKHPGYRRGEVFML